MQLLVRHEMWLEPAGAHANGDDEGAAPTRVLVHYLGDDAFQSNTTPKPEPKPTPTPKPILSLSLSLTLTVTQTLTLAPPGDDAFQSNTIPPQPALVEADGAAVGGVAGAAVGGMAGAAVGGLTATPGVAEEAAPLP